MRETKPASATSARARERSPRLVLVFALLTALGVAAAAAVIVTVVRHADAARAHDAAGDRARFATRAVLAPALRPADLTSVGSVERRQQLDRLFRRVMLEGVNGAALYRADGRQVYSATGVREHEGSVRAHVRDALEGTTVSEISSTPAGLRVLRTFVPIAGDDNKVAGVVRLDQDYEPIAAAVERSSLLIAGVLEVLLVLLFLGLVPVLARASARLRAHVADLERIATHDEVTGLLNRNGFRREVELRLTDQGSSAVLLVELDGFSEINGTLGSASGDRLVIEAGERLQRELEPGQALGRVGEDEFGVLCSPCSATEAERIAQRVVRAFAAAPFVVNGVRMAVAADVGVGLFPEHGPDVDAVLSGASTALLAAKEDDRSNVHVYGPEHSARDHNRLAIAAELRDGLAAGELCVFYQPQADFLTHQIRGVEALLRWQHPARGLLVAEDFISYVERSGLAQEIRRFVVAEAALQWRAWYELGFDLELAVNLSAVDMLDPTLPDEIEFVTSRHGLPPWNLVLEITERALIADERRVRKIVERLDDLGVRLAVDDFGT
jgi:diguanylate cyclase (GGDEF)-like protein